MADPLIGKLPALFIARLASIIPPEEYVAVVKTFECPTSFGLRVNTLKSSYHSVSAALTEAGVPFRRIPYLPEGVSIASEFRSRVCSLPVVSDGGAYLQDPASMLVAHVLDPHPGETVLDMCAAPGSKTSHIAALTNNEACIVALDVVRSRMYRLRAVLKNVGATNVETVCIDARRYRVREDLFDRILVDAPCSSEGRFWASDPGSVGYWSLRKIREMQKKQKGLLLSATRLLKQGGTLVYSTCTFAPEENEEVVSWVLRKTDGAVELVDIHHDGIPTYPALMTWSNKEFPDQIRRCLRILPTTDMGGFFIAKFRKP